MNFFVGQITGLHLYTRPCERRRENEGVDPAARTVARYRRRGVEISLQSDRRVGGRVPSAISMTLHPANVQDAHRTPVPDVSVGRIRVEGDGRTYVYASVRLAGPIRSRSTVTSFAVPSPITPIAFTFAPVAGARARALKSKAFSCAPLPPFPSRRLSCARCRLASGKGMDSKGGPFSLHIDGDPRRIHATRRVRERMRSHNQHY